MAGGSSGTCGLPVPAVTAKDFDHVIFGAAPTGHTLRLMSLAKAWDQILDQNTSGTSCLDRLAGSGKQRDLHRATVNTLDLVADTAAYQSEVMQAQGAAMDDAGGALLEQGPGSPCTEEIAVSRAFAREVGREMDRFVVLYNAPTSHTSHLLDASEAYQRELVRQARITQPEEVLKLHAHLRCAGCCVIRESGMVQLDSTR